MRRMRLFFTCMRPATTSHTPRATSLPRVAISCVIAITAMVSLHAGRGAGVLAADDADPLRDEGPEEQQQGERGDRPHEGVGEEDLHVPLREEHRLPERVL